MFFVIKIFENVGAELEINAKERGSETPVRVLDVESYILTQKEGQA